MERSFAPPSRRSSRDIRRRDILEEYGIGCVRAASARAFSPTSWRSTIPRRMRGADGPDRSSRLPRTGCRPATAPEGPRCRIAGDRVFAPHEGRWVGEHGTSSVSSRWSPRSWRVRPGVGGNRSDRCSKGLDFIRSYADRFHHAKEEDILFACFDPGLDILKAMHEDHDRGRAHVRGVVEALEQGDRRGCRPSRRLCGVLSEHIKKEDEILYPGWTGTLGAAGGRPVRAVPRGGRAVRGGTEKVRGVRRADSRKRTETLSEVRR